MDELNIMVVGAGTMGAEIALAFAMVGQDVWLVDLPGVSQKAIDKLLKKYTHDPHRLAALERIKTGNVFENLENVRDRRWLIEAVPENLSMKVEVFQKLAPFINSEAVITSNTSGISIRRIRSMIPEQLRSSFFGTHFFNPASHNRLVELIPADVNNLNKFWGIRANLIRMGKICVESIDEPNFIVNRFAFYFVMDAFEEALRLGLDVPMVDALSGKVIGRPSTATFGLLDLIGLDVWLAICENMGTETARYPNAMRVIRSLASAGMLGRKSGSGFYQYGSGTVKGALKPWLDIGTLRYEDPLKAQTIDHGVDLQGSLKKMVSYNGSFAGPLFQKTLITSMISSANQVLQLAPDGKSSVDTAIKVGLGHEMGPFELGGSLTSGSIEV